MASDAPALLRHSDFLPYEGQAFRFEGWDGTLRLDAVRTATPPGWPADLRPPFTLIFHGPRTPVLQEAMHVAEAADGARFAFHIMPVHTPAPDRQDYQAVFN
jgi:hypothetical protein